MRFWNHKGKLNERTVKQHLEEFLKLAHISVATLSTTVKAVVLVDVTSVTGFIQ